MQYDVLVVGAGVVGCATAMELGKYSLRAAVIEAGEDVCTFDAEKVARESAASDKQAQALSEERERRRAELADSLAEAEVRRHAEELQRGAGTANAEEDNFF